MALSLPDNQAIRRLVAHLPNLTDVRPEPLFEESPEPGVVSLNPDRNPPEVWAFSDCLYREGFILENFNWAKWDEGVAIAEDPERIASADLETLCKLLTLHARQDHFVGGHLASACESGLIAPILERLAELAGVRPRDEQGSS